MIIRCGDYYIHKCPIILYCTIEKCIGPGRGKPPIDHVPIIVPRAVIRAYLASVFLLVVGARFPPSPHLLCCIGVGGSLSPSSCHLYPLRLPALPVLLPWQHVTVAKTGVKRFVKLPGFLSRLASNCEICAFSTSWLVPLIVAHVVTESQGHLTFFSCGVDLERVSQCWWLSGVRHVSAIAPIAVYTYAHSIYVIIFLGHVSKCIAKACNGVGEPSLWMCVCVCKCVCVRPWPCTVACMGVWFKGVCACMLYIRPQQFNFLFLRVQNQCGRAAYFTNTRGKTQPCPLICYIDDLVFEFQQSTVALKQPFWISLCSMVSKLLRLVLRTVESVRELVVFFCCMIVKICMRILSIYKALVFSILWSIGQKSMWAVDENGILILLLWPYALNDIVCKLILLLFVSVLKLTAFM